MVQRQRILTEADKRAAAKVRALWADYQKKNPGISQDTAAAEAGMGQSAFSQFLRGAVAMRVTPVLKLAKLFGVDPSEIRDDLPDLAYSAARRMPAAAAREPAPANYVSKHTAARDLRHRDKKPARSEGEKLLVIVRTFLETESIGKNDLYALALAVADADESRKRARRGKTK